jgi:hypothetical protein
MPALPAAAGVVRTALSGTTTGAGVWLTRFYTHYSGTPPTNAQLATYDAAIGTAWGTNIKPLQNAALALVQIASEDLTSATGAVDTTASAQTGTRAGSALPSSAAAVISYVIARRYRGGHPRGYWPLGADSDLNSETQWTAAFVASLNTGLANFFTAVAAAGWTGAGTLTHVNVSYYSGFTVITQDLVTGVSAKLSIGTQRRRLNFFD